MSSRPSTVPQLDTNQTYRTIPTPSQVTDGYVLNAPLPAANVNYLWGWAGDWLTWLDERTEDGATPTVDFSLRGRDALTATGDGGTVTITGGDGGSTSGDGGDIILMPGTVTSGTPGRVGLGTPTPGYLLHMYGSTPYLTIENDLDTGAVAISMKTDDVGTEKCSWEIGVIGPNVGTASGDMYFYQYKDATGATVNRQPLRLSDSGKVAVGGAGLVDPDGTLHVHTGSAGTVTASTNADDLVVENTTRVGISLLSGTNETGSIFWGNPSSTSEAGIDYLSANGQMSIFVDDGSYTFTIRDGKVGINHVPTATSGALEVNGGTQTDIIATCDNSSGAYNEMGFMSKNGATVYSSWWVGAQGYQASVNPGTFFVFHGKNVAGGTVNSTPFYIGNDDKIGMGNDCVSPLGSVHVKTSSAGSITPNVGADDFIIESSGYTGMTIMSPATSGGGTIAFAYPGSPLAGQVYFDADDDKIYLQVGASPNYLMVDSSGHIGMKTATPDGTCHVHTATAGSITAHADADDLVVENSTNTGISILAAKSGWSSIYFDNPTDGVGDAGIDYDHTNKAMHMWTNGSYVFTLDTNGALTTGDIQITSTGSPPSGALGRLYNNSSEGLMHYLSEVSQYQQVGRLQHKRVTVTSAQFKNLNSVPVEIIPSPGGGLRIDMIKASATVDYGTVAYTGGNDIRLGYGTSGLLGLLFDDFAQTFFTATSDSYISTVPKDPASGYVLSTNFTNKPVYLANPSTDFATGDSSVIIDVWYVVVPSP